MRIYATPSSTDAVDGNGNGELELEVGRESVKPGELGEWGGERGNVWEERKGGFGTIGVLENWLGKGI